MKYCECLIGLVGLKDVCETPNGCLLYLNDLPNISREAFALLTDSDRKKISDVFEEIEKRAAAKIYLSLVSAMKGNFLKGRPSDRFVTGQFDSDDPLLSLENKLKGQRIRLGESEYLSADLTQILIWSEANISGAVFYVYDLYTGLMIDSITQDLAGGQVNAINLSGKKYSSLGDIFIAYDASIVQSKEITREFDSYDPYCECTCGASGCKSFPFIGGSDLTDQRIYTDSLESESCSMILSYTKKCDFEEFVCKNIDSGIGLILQYQMGIEFWKEDRLDNILNWFSLIKKEDKFSYRSDLEEDLKEAMTNFIAQVDGDNVCFECSKGGQVVIQLP